jgi:transcriptional regulator with XRE-family HTH domain
MTNFKDVRVIMAKISPEKVFKLELNGRVKGIRERKGISQSELSRLSGVPQKTISRMEAGLSSPNMETMCKLIDSMGYKIEFELKEK